MHWDYKLKCAARTYNLAVNHLRRILRTTKGYPAHFNDKILITFNDFVKSIKDSKYNDQYNFELLDFDENYNEIKVKYKGYYLIVGNCYLD